VVLGGDGGCGDGSAMGLFVAATLHLIDQVRGAGLVGWLKPALRDSVLVPLG
jgi:hypothetical protein